MAEKKTNIHQKLLEAKKRVPYLQKDKAGHQYKYASPDQVLGTMNPILNELGLRLKTEIIDVRTEPVFLKPKAFDVWVDGKKTQQTHDVYETIYHLTMRMTWIDTETGEKDENMWFASGVNGHELGNGSACTYGERYFMLKAFNIPTGEDDPDNFQNKHMSEEEKKRIEAADQARVDGLRKAAMAAIEAATSTQDFVDIRNNHEEALALKDVAEAGKKKFEEIKAEQAKSEANPAGMTKKADEPEEAAPASSMTDEAIADIGKQKAKQDLVVWAKTTVKTLENVKESVEDIERFKTAVNLAADNFKKK